MGVIVVTVVGAKNEASVPWTGAHVRLSVHGPKKTGRSPPNAFCYVAECCGLEQEVLRRGVKALEESFRPMVPDFLHGAPPTDACAAFFEESRMKFINAREFDRKSGAVIDNHFDTGILFFEGTYDSATKSFTYSRGIEAGSGATTIKTRVATLDEDHYTEETFFNSGGGDIRVTELTYTRVKPSSSPSSYLR